MTGDAPKELFRW